MWHHIASAHACQRFESVFFFFFFFLFCFVFVCFLCLFVFVLFCFALLLFLFILVTSHATNPILNRINAQIRHNQGEEKKKCWYHNKIYYFERTRNFFMNYFWSRTLNFATKILAGQKGSLETSVMTATFDLIRVLSAVLLPRLPYAVKCTNLSIMYII